MENNDNGEKLDQCLHTCREFLRRQFPLEHSETGLLTLFLVRAYRSAEAAERLMRHGYSLEALGTARTIAETAIEFEYIVCDPAKLQRRLELFYQHARYHQLQRGRAVTSRTGGTDVGSTSLADLEESWAQVSAMYSSGAPWHWSKEHTSIRKRAFHIREVQRRQLAEKEAVKRNVNGELSVAELEQIRDGLLQQAGAFPGAELFVHVYELIYSQGCLATHPGSTSMGAMVDWESRGSISVEIAPEPAPNFDHGEYVVFPLTLLGYSLADHLDDETAEAAFLKFLDREGD